LYAFRNKPHERWGQAIVNTFNLKGKISDSLFYETDEAVVENIVDKMVLDYNLVTS
jgi:hypothetical protein